MPQQVLNAVENNFTKGLITEFTGLNFPENAATAATNSMFTLIGDVVRREGIDFETNGTVQPLVSRAGSAMSDYKWNNAGGDGLTQIVVSQVGATLFFFKSTDASLTSPLSSHKMSFTVDISQFTAINGNFNPGLECQFSDGNGYLFVYHPSCDPFYCALVSGNVIASIINVKIRDFSGLPDGLDAVTRPSVLSAEHQYNLQNQGWTQGGAWIATSTTTVQPTQGSKTFTVASGLAISVNDTCSIYCTDPNAANYGVSGLQVAMSGTVTAYSTTQLTINVTYNIGGFFSAAFFSSWTITQTNLGHINAWHSAETNYPSNGDVWWYFKDSTGVFNPTATAANITVSSTPAPKGHYILNAFNQQRGLVSSTSGLTDIVTTSRPKTGTWFQGRVWYTGVDAAQGAIGDAPYYTWTENIYFSQIITDASQFGNCYQTNDPTSQTFFNILPSDGGVIQIQGCGSIYKLFPLVNAMIIFAANGVWYMTGSTGVGFAANDYTIVKLSSVRSISSTSFVDVLGLPIFWNEEGIYQVEFAKQGTHLLSQPLHVNPLDVNPITVGTILSFYNNIPLQSKKYVRGAYHPIDYVVQWTYRSTNESNVTDRYQFDSLLNFNTYNKAFYPYSISTSPSNAYIHGIRYVEGPGGTNSPPPAFKYFSSDLINGVYNYSFADEHDPTFVDWFSIDGVGVNFVSNFTTGYKLHGQGERRFQVPYIYLYSRLGQPVSYYIQSLWDYPLNTDSGRWSVNQLTNINSPNFGMAFRRHRLRGWGLVLQLRISSVDGKPFDVMGWSLYETANQGV